MAGPFERLLGRNQPKQSDNLDRQRWETLENNEDWNDRARIIAPFLAGHLPVLDIGSGTQFLKQVVGAENYVSADSVGTHGADYVVDLNQASVPQEALARVRSVTYLGVLEYLADPEKHLVDAMADGRRVVFTYTPLDTVADLAVRQSNGWQSHLTFAQLDAMVSRLVSEPVAAQRYRSQVMYVLGQPEPEEGRELPAPKVSRKPKLVISGFFARGNTGDEALLQRIYETFSPHIDLICSLDRTGAYEGFWDWYPYNRMEIIHQGELARLLESDVVGMHIGGGGLPLGFNAAQLSIAGVVGKPVVSTGVDDPLRMLASHSVDISAVARYIDAFKAFEVRTPSSLDALTPITDRVALGADWAFDLGRDAGAEPAFDGVTVVVRELPRFALDRQRAREYREVFKALDKRNIPVRLLPFCPEDERYLEWLEPTWRYKIERHWWNAQRCKEVIASSRGLISIGRLHPLIFAAHAGTPALAIDIDTERFTTVGATSKIADHAREFDIPYFPGMSSFLEAIGDGQDLPMRSQVDPSYIARLEGMRQRALSALGIG